MMQSSLRERRRLDGANHDEILEDVNGSSSGQEDHKTPSSHDGLSSSRNVGASTWTPRKSALHPTTLESMGQATSPSIFNLQVNELLTGLLREHERKAREIDVALKQIKGIIDGLPAQDAKPVALAEQHLGKLYNIQVPFPEPRPSENTKYSLSYAKPADVSVVGSYSQKTFIGNEGTVSVDLAVTMPSEIFQGKDHLNYRYFHKRAFYLACLASGVQAARDYKFTTSYAYQNDNELQPILLIVPITNSAQQRYQIRILLAASQDLFTIAKTLPNKNCIRAQCTDGSSSNGLPPTPFYNASLRSECCTRSFSKMLHAALAHSKAFKDACILGNVWLHQRGFGAGIRSGGFGPFEWACILALLMQGGGSRGQPLLSKGYNKIQLFRAVLHFLHTRDLVTNPLILQAVHIDLAQVSAPVIFDGSRGVNILFKVTKWSYRMLRHEAGIGLQVMNAALGEPFETLFIRRVDEPMHRFDSVLSLQVPKSRDSRQSFDAQERGSRVCQQVYDALLIGLGERVRLVFCWCSKTIPWSTGSTAPPIAKTFTANIGLIFNAEQAFRIVDHGPPNEDQAAATQYRQFWGEKAELRRFRDGSLLETLVWSQTSDESIVKQVVRYVLQRHCGQDVAQSLQMSGESFHGSITRFDRANPASTTISAFERVEKDIRRLEGLPLQIRQITTASAHSRYAALTEEGPAGSGTQPVDICVQFEGSVRWPNNIMAVQRTKIAFLYKLGELLEELGTEGLITKVGFEHQDSNLLNIAFLDILYPQQGSFRLRIHHERELNLLESALREKNPDVGAREAIVFAVANYKRAFIQGPLHTQAVRTLCTRYPLLSPTMRLMRKWRDSHLLSGHISDALVELLTIYIFVNPWPWEAPGSLATAFLRTLTFISKWQWQTEPLIVDFNGIMSKPDIDQIRLRFEAWRKIDPAMNRVVLFVASNVDHDGITWTEPHPAKVIAVRFTALARAACEILGNQGLDMQPEKLFIPSTTDYDFVVYLNPAFTSNRLRSKQQKHVFKNLQTHLVECQYDTTTNPINLYIEELRALYGGHVLFFHNDHDGTFVGGLWNPQTGQRAWRTHMAYSAMPLIDEEKEYISLNQNATLHDIAKLGGDLVSKIQVR